MSIEEQSSRLARKHKLDELESRVFLFLVIITEIIQLASPKTPKKQGLSKSVHKYLRRESRDMKVMLTRLKATASKKVLAALDEYEAVSKTA